MMQRILQGIAVITHPVFAPFYSYMIYSAVIQKHGDSPLVLGMIWLIFAYLMLPILYFVKVRKYNIKSPNVDERRSMYKVYGLVSAGFMIVSYFTLDEYIAFFAGLAVMHLLLYLMAWIGMKTSWHTATWAFLTMAALILYSQMRMVDFENIVILFAGFTIVVFLCRLLQKAHSVLELIVGLAAGIIASQIIILI